MFFSLALAEGLKRAGYSREKVVIEKGTSVLAENRVRVQLISSTGSNAMEVALLPVDDYCMPSSGMASDSCVSGADPPFYAATPFCLVFTGGAVAGHEEADSVLQLVTGLDRTSNQHFPPPDLPDGICVINTRQFAFHLEIEIAVSGTRRPCPESLRQQRRITRLFFVPDFGQVKEIWLAPRTELLPDGPLVARAIQEIAHALNRSGSEDTWSQDVLRTFHLLRSGLDLEDGHLRDYARRTLDRITSSGW